MTANPHGSRPSYQRGCRCDLCKGAESEYRRGLRQRHREEVGEFAATAAPSLSLVTDALTRTNANPFPANPVEAAVSAELEALGSHTRPGLAAAALAMARLLDNPKATSTKPAAAKALVTLLDKLRSSADHPRGRLALVRAMTEKGGD